MNNLKYKTLIIGAGRIGAFYDEPNNNQILSHAHGITNNINFELCGFIDNNLEVAQKAAQIWNTNYYLTIEACIEENTIDVIVIAVPDEVHFSWLTRALKFKPKLIILEKPIVTTIADAKVVEKLVMASNTVILVNYSRRYEPIYSYLKEMIRSGQLGVFTNGHGYYGKGIIHNGTHMLDMLNYFVGEFIDFSIIESFTDYTEADPTVSAILKYSTGQFYLQAVNSNKVTIFEIDLLFENGRIRMSELGRLIEVYKAKESKQLKDYIFYEKTETNTLQKNMSISNLYDHAKDLLTRDIEPICSVKDSIKVFLQGLSLKEGRHID